MCKRNVNNKMKRKKNCIKTIIFNYRYRDPCSASINEDDLHTTKLVGDGNKKVSTENVH